MAKDVRVFQIKVTNCHQCPKSSFWGEDGWSCAKGGDIVWADVENKVADNCPLSPYQEDKIDDKKMARE